MFSAQLSASAEERWICRRKFGRDRSYARPTTAPAPPRPRHPFQLGNGMEIVVIPDRARQS